MRTLFILTAGAVFVFIGLTYRDHPRVYAWASGNPLYVLEADASCRSGGEVAAVLRNDGAGWYAIDDETHSPLNVAFVESDARSIRVYFTFDARLIHTFVISPDETLALAGVFAGASVRTNSAQIPLSRAGVAGTRRVSPLHVSTERFPLSNLWIYGRFSADC